MSALRMLAVQEEILAQLGHLRAELALVNARLDGLVGRAPSRRPSSNATDSDYPTPQP